VNMPITMALYDVLFKGKNAKDAVDVLMARGRTHEMEDLVNIHEEKHILE
jgi:glycerol-3-phosphate dehydrogenase (NAD(P)+)